MLFTERLEHLSSRFYLMTKFIVPPKIANDSQSAHI